jgi:hypothetical protein
MTVSPRVWCVRRYAATETDGLAVALDGENELSRTFNVDEQGVLYLRGMGHISTQGMAAVSVVMHRKGKQARCARGLLPLVSKRLCLCNRLLAVVTLCWPLWTCAADYVEGVGPAEHP